MTSDELLECPYCGGAVPADVTICPSCQEDLSALIKLRNTYAIYYNDALTLAREGNLAQAQARAELAIGARPEFPPARVLLAKLQARQGLWAQAQASLDRARELTPDDATLDELAQAVAQGALDAQKAPSRAPAQPQPTALTPRAAAEQQLAIYERDVKRAFGMGAAVMGGVALLWRLFFGRRHD